MRGKRPGIWVIVLALVVAVLAPTSSHAGQVDYVVHVSVDGLRSDAVTAQTAAALPNFYRLRNEGAFTDNARTDVNYTVTLPNHVDQMTGRGVSGPAGGSHGWTANSWSSGQTLHGGGYIAGVYDVVHDSGLRTGHYASKDKFELFDESWNAANGAADTTGPDNGKDKIDRFLYTDDTGVLTSTWASEMTATPQNYSFVHYRDPDSAGHDSEWMSAAYLTSVQTVDGYLGQIFTLVENDAALAGKTAIIVTADHGGHDDTHGSIIESDYVIPFYVWGPGVTAGGDLYAMNPLTRQNPGVTMPAWTDAIQPIRNGDAPNLVLDLLNLPAIPDSGINLAQDLAVPEPATMGLLVIGGLLGLRRRRR